MDCCAKQRVLRKVKETAGLAVRRFFCCSPQNRHLIRCKLLRHSFYKRRFLMRVNWKTFVIGMALAASPALADGPYKIVKTEKAGGPGGMDYINIDAAD